jgi:hypothetical protein
MVYDSSSEAKATEDSQLDTTRGSTAKLKRFEEILVKGKSGIVICLLICKARRTHCDFSRPIQV